MTDRTVVYRLQADVTQLRAQMAAAGASVRGAADSMTAANREGTAFRGGLKSLGDTAGKVGLVAAAGLGAAVMKAADFDAAMSNVQAATHESASAMDDLREAALKAGADTAFSATEAAAGIENLAKAGISTQDILGGALAGALDLAAAGEMEVADAAEAAAGAMAQFKLEGDQATHVADLLAAGAGKAQGDVSDMVQALKQAGTVSAQTGLSLEETVGSLSALAEQSLLGSDAGTSLKTMLAALTPNSVKAANAMEQYNIHAFDAQGNFVGMTELAGQLRNGLSGLTDEQRAMTLETIFGSDAVRAASIIYDNGAEGIAKWTANVDDAGYASETATIKLDNLKGDLEALGGSFETALIGTGSSSQGPLRSLVQSLTNGVNAYNDLGQGAKSGVAITLGATAALGGGLFVFSKMVQSIAATRAAMEALGLTAQRTQGLVAAAGKGMGIALAAGVAIAASDLGDVDYSLDSINRQLELLAAKGDAAGVLENLSMSADTLGEALRDAAYNDFNLFGMGAGQEIEELDAALAGLDPAVAAETFKVLVEEGTKAGVAVGDVKALFPQYAAALKLAGQEAEAGISPTEEYAAAIQELPAPISTATREAEKLSDVLDGLNGILDQRGNVRSYQAAIDDLAESLKENGKTFDITTEKGRNNQAALDGIASSALAVAEGLDTAARKKFLTNAITDLRTMGNSMGLPKAEINRLIGLLEKANKTRVKPVVDVDAVGAMTAIERIRNAMLGIKDKSVTIRVTQTGAGVSPGFGPQANAEGGFITGPGTATSDSIPSYLSNGEYVIKAAAVDKYGVHMFDRLNAMHFADGGKVDKKKRTATGGLFVADRTEALEQAIDILTHTLEDQTNATERDIATRDEWASKMADVAAGTISGFNTGLFDKGNAWGAGGGALSNLTKDIAGLEQRGALQSQLAGMGISGDALSALLSQGSNADISGLIASGQATTVASLIAQRAALQDSTGMAGAQAAYGQQYAYADQRAQASAAIAQQTNIEIAGLRGDVARMEKALAMAADRAGDSFGSAIRGEAAKGHRDKKNRGSR